MNELPEPLIAAEVNLQDFAFMPLMISKLRRSRAWSVVAKRDPRLGFYMMNTWAESWHETPAGSLPNDDDLLCEVALCQSMEVWTEVKQKVLQGWILCADNRWYHPTVCEMAEEAWKRKMAQFAKTEAARAMREAVRRGEALPKAERDRIEKEALVRKGYEEAQKEIKRRARRRMNPEPAEAEQPKQESSAPKAPPASPAETPAQPEAVAQKTEPKRKRESKGERLPDGWVLPPDWEQAACDARRRHGLPEINITLEAEMFANHWIQSDLPSARKRDWRRAFINWCLMKKGGSSYQSGRGDPSKRDIGAAIDRLMPGTKPREGMLDLGDGPVIDGSFERGRS